LVVGVHFVPLDRVFPGIGLRGLAVAVVCVAVAAFLIGASTATAPSTITGLGAGACLLARRGAAGRRGPAQLATSPPYG
jgi:hypothetical protein